LAAEIKTQFNEADVALVPGGRGDFVVTADGSQLWDKRRMGDEFPDPAAIIEKLNQL